MTNDKMKLDASEEDILMASQKKRMDMQLSLSKLKDLHKVKIKTNADRYKQIAGETDQDVLDLIKRKIDQAQGEIDELSIEILELEQSIKNLRFNEKDINNQSDLELVDKVLEKFRVRYLIDTDKFVMYRNISTDPRRCEVQYKEYSSHVIVRFLNKHTNKILTCDKNVVTDYIQEKGWSYDGVASTLNASTYGDTSFYNSIKEIREYWLAPNVEDTNYNQAIDFWLHCLSGGKTENKEHLEKLIMFKYLYPEKVANTPNFDISSNPGGTGKGAFINFLRTIFTDHCVCQATLSEADKFNAGWNNKIWVIFDDTKTGALDNDKMKNITGDTKIKIEPKGVDAYQVERMFTIGITHQGPGTRVNLTGGGVGSEDRRWSVMNTQITMIDEAMRRIPGLLTDTTITEEEKMRQAADYVNTVYQVLLDRIEVAKWMGNMLSKHGAALVSGQLTALHKTDYHNLKKMNRAPIDDAMNTIIELVKDTNGISMDLVMTLMHLLVPNDLPRANKFSPVFEVALNNAKIPFAVLEQQRITEVFGTVTNKSKKQTKYFSFNNSTACIDDYSKVLLAAPSQSKYGSTKAGDSWTKLVMEADQLVYQLEDLAK